MNHSISSIEFEYLIAKFLYRVNFLNISKKVSAKFFINTFKLSRNQLNKIVKLTKKKKDKNNLDKLKIILEQIYHISQQTKNKPNLNEDSLNKNKIFFIKSNKNNISNIQILKESIQIIKNEIKLSDQINSVLKYSKNYLENIKQINLSFMNKITHVEINLKKNFNSDVLVSKSKKIIFFVINIIFIYFLIIICN
nr:hypothetical protein CcurKRNrm2_p158 [Cryptomonas curvata]